MKPSDRLDARSIADEDILAQFSDVRTRVPAFNLLVRKYQERLYWACRRIVLWHSDTDDVLQEVFIKVWNKLPGFRTDAKLYTWLYRIAINESLRHLARQKKRRGLALDDPDLQLADKLVADPYFNGDKALTTLYSAADSLPEKQRLVFTLRYFENMPYDDIAEITETSAGALKASYHHAVKKIEAAIKAAVGDLEL